MEMRDHCAYNETRECFLALEVADVDISDAKVRDLTASLALNSGEGLWMVPFTGIPATGVGIALDLVYLDRECVVIDVQESFLTSRDVSSRLGVASVLVLPRHSIYSSQTQPGDRLILCTAEEMVLRLERLSTLGGHAGAGQNAALLMETPLWRGSTGQSESKQGAKIRNHKAQAPDEKDPDNSDKKSLGSLTNWLRKWWSPDPRKSAREPVQDLAAYYWNGSRPTAQTIRDITSKGIYVVTEERWYPGTLVLMTLQRTDSEEGNGERSIHVYAKAVRWGKDGVGLQFVLPHSDLPGGLKPPVQTVNRKQLDGFLEALRKARKLGAP